MEGEGFVWRYVFACCYPQDTKENSSKQEARSRRKRKEVYDIFNTIRSAAGVSVMKKKPTVGKLKKKLWPIFSRYIRLKYADENGTVQCVTCKKLMYWKEAQAGHFVDGRANRVLFDEKLVHPQCYACNVGRKGNKIPYVKFMMKKYHLTLDECCDLDMLKFQVKKFTITDLEEKIEHYSEEVKTLLDNKQEPVQ